MRLGNLEYRHLTDSGRDAEIVAWSEDSKGNEFCYTLLFWRKDKEGYFIEFVGSRPLSKDINTGVLFKFMRYGQAILDAYFEVFDGQ